MRNINTGLAFELTRVLFGFIFVLLNSCVSHFWQADINGSNYIELSELRDALKSVGVDIPGYQARDLEQQFKKSDSNKDGKLSLEEFEKVGNFGLNELEVWMVE